MTLDPCARGTVLTRSGLTQPARRLPELARDHFLPDERDLADLVLFGQRFARHIKYYDAANVADGDWTAFFENDVTAALAALSKLPIEAVRTSQGDVARWLRADPARPTAELGLHFRLWFHLALTPLEQIGRHARRLPGDHTLAQSLPILVNRDLAAPLGSVAAWYKGAIPTGANLFTDTAVVAAGLNLTGAPGNTAPRLSATIAELVLNRPAFGGLALQPALFTQTATPDWPALYAAAAADISPFADAITPYDQIYDGLSYNLLDRAVERLMQGYLRVRADATSALLASITDFAAHPAHYGLWLTFLDLFRHAQSQMNQFTGRHLDHYFRDVLRLQPRPAQPDSAHLTFELAKGTPAHLLAKGTAFRAGKDALGNAVTFALADDLVINRAQVAQLSAVRVETALINGTMQTAILAAPDVASMDGLGEVPLPKDHPEFPPFGPAASPYARVGFAVADRKLFLREGLRTIVIRAAHTSTAIAGLNPKVAVRLSGPKGWFEPSSVSVRMRSGFSGDSRDTADLNDKAYLRADHHNKTYRKKARSQSAAQSSPAAATLKVQPVQANQAAKYAANASTAATQSLLLIEFEIKLLATEPAVVPVDPALHGDDHAPGLPVAEITLDFSDEGTRRAFTVLRDLNISRPTLEVDAQDLKDITLIAAGAEIDPAKPFTPFGPRPRVGDALIIGSSEIFSKPIASWSLKVGWQTPYSNTGFFTQQLSSAFSAQEFILSNGLWQSQGQGAVIALGQSSGTITLVSGPAIDGLADQTTENPAFDAKSVRGFARLDLKQDFGHHLFPTEQARAMMAMARGVGHTLNAAFNYEGHSLPATLNALPKPPYEPIVTSISAGYQTTRSPVTAFRHLHPFGSALSAGGRLFPEFPFQAALYIGVQDFTGPARLTLLAQVADGSGDPLLPVPPLSFAYLEGDAFVPMAAQDVDDKTLNLTGSAVIGLSLPAKADTDHSVLPDGLTWLQISVQRHATALNCLLGVTAQAARAVFVDAQNDPIRLATALPAGSISKTQAPDITLKTISQPYHGFGGRPVESPAAMDTRVSERLRHKNRGITMWDIEALVLDAFPGLYRVKCLGLTALKRNSDGVVLADNETQPGAVTVVAVPIVATLSARNPLRPYVDQATLTAVDAFLRRRLSPFVKLEVVNPRIEEVQVNFKLRFKPHIADTAFYADRLNSALVAFLTPWLGEASQDVSFGGKLWKSTLIDFLDEQPEVDFVTDVRMYHKPDIALAPGAWTPIDSDVIETTSARSILVSAPVHGITELPKGVSP